MPIEYSGGVLVYDDLAADDNGTLLEELKASLEAAGYTTESSQKSYVILTFLGLPSNGETFTLAGDVYTFLNAINNANPREILIGATKEDCTQYAYDCINDTGNGEGVTYSAATVAHPTLEAVDPAGGDDLTIQKQTAGGGSFVVSEAIGQAQYNWTTSRGAGHKLVSAVTPQGLSHRIAFADGGSAYLEAVFSAVDEEATAYSPTYRLATSVGSTLKILACQYQFFVFQLNTASASDTCLEGGVPLIRSAFVAPIISAIEDDGAGQIKVTTATAHNLQDGDTAFVANGTKNAGEIMTALNGAWEIDWVDATHYILVGSTYEAGYDANSAAAANQGQLARCIWSMGHIGGNQETFRRSITPSASVYGHQCQAFVCVNQNHWAGNANGPIVLKVPATTIVGGNNLAVGPKLWGGYVDLVEPRLCVRVTSASGDSYEVGQLWNAFVTAFQSERDVLVDNLDGHDWISYCDTYCGTNSGIAGNLWIARG